MAIGKIKFSLENLCETGTTTGCRILQFRSIKPEKTWIWFLRLKHESPGNHWAYHQGNQLPEEKAEEISTFTGFVMMKQYEEHQLLQGIQKIASNSSAFDFLNEEENLYTEADLLCITFHPFPVGQFS